MGPYLSERQWRTVREDYSNDGNAWAYFLHDQTRSRAYRWGEDGLAGISDSHQVLCFVLALWNGRDSILKERLFGLTNSEGNHGEDVKECYFCLDSTPTLQRRVIAVLEKAIAAVRKSIEVIDVATPRLIVRYTGMERKAWRVGSRHLPPGSDRYRQAYQVCVDS